MDPSAFYHTRSRTAGQAVPLQAKLDHVVEVITVTSAQAALQAALYGPVPGQSSGLGRHTAVYRAFDKAPGKSILSAVVEDATMSPSPEEYEALTQQVPDSALSILQDAAGVYSAGSFRYQLQPSLDDAPQAASTQTNRSLYGNIVRQTSSSSALSLSGELKLSALRRMGPAQMQEAILAHAQRTQQQQHAAAAAPAAAVTSALYGHVRAQTSGSGQLNTPAAAACMPGAAAASAAAASSVPATAQQIAAEVLRRHASCLIGKPAAGQAGSRADGQDNCSSDTFLDCQEDMNEVDSHMLLDRDDTDMLTHGSEHAAVHAHRAAHAQAASHGTVQQKTDMGQHPHNALRRRPSDQEHLVRMEFRTTAQRDAVRTADYSAAMAAAKQEQLLYQEQQQAVAEDLNTEPLAATACRPPPKSRTAHVQVQVHPQALEWTGPKRLTPHAQGREHVPAVLAHKTAKLYGVYAPTVYSDSTSLEALQLANQVMRRSVLPGSTLYMDVPETSDLYRWGVSLGFTAYAVCLGSSYFQRLLDTIPYLGRAIMGEPSYIDYAERMYNGAGAASRLLPPTVDDQVARNAGIESLKSIQFTCVFLATKMVDRVQHAELLRFMLTQLYQSRRRGEIVTRAQALEVESKCLEGLQYRLGPFYAEDPLAGSPPCTACHWPY